MTTVQKNKQQALLKAAAAVRALQVPRKPVAPVQPFPFKAYRKEEQPA